MTIRFAMVVRVGGGILEWCERDVVVAADDLARDTSAFPCKGAALEQLSLMVTR